MAQMIRKQIYIPKLQEARLKQLAKARGVSEATIIREALDHQISGRSVRRVLHHPEAFEQAYRFMLSRRKLAPAVRSAYRWKREEAYTERENRYGRR